MKVVADECISPIVVESLRQAGHEVHAIAGLAPGVLDQSVLAIATEMDAVLVTEDLDFGELVFRQGRTHGGVILMRLPADFPEEKAAKLLGVLHDYADVLPGNFVVISPRFIRLRKASTD